MLFTVALSGFASRRRLSALAASVFAIAANPVLGAIMPVATMGGIVNVAELLDVNGNTDLAEEIQRIIDTNPNRTLWFSDGVYPISKPICTPADPARAVSLRLSDFAVLKAASGWAHTNAMVRLGGIHPANNNRSPTSGYGLFGGVIDGAGVAVAISIESGRETRVQNVNLRGARVGIHVMRGANGGFAINVQLNAAIC